MKKIVLSVAAVAMLFVSCTKENIAGSSENLVKINVSTGFDTKAQFGAISEGTYPVLWSEGDKIQIALASVSSDNRATRSVFVQASGAAVLSNGGASATFAAEVSEIPDATRYQYFSYAPAGSQAEKWGCWQIEKSQSRLIIPSVQTPLAGSPDPRAMAFYGKSVIYDSFVTNPEISYTHLTGYGCLSFRNLSLEAGDAVERVVISTPDNIIAGQYSIMYGDDYQASLKNYEITINTSATENIYFAVNTVTPKTNTISTRMKITVITVKGNTLEKDIDVAGHPIQFQQGKCVKFTVDMTGVGETDPVFPSGYYLLGNAAAGGKELKACLEDPTKYAWFGELKAGNLKIARFDESVPTYINHDGAFAFGVAEDIASNSTAAIWNIPADGNYRVVYDKTNETVTVYDPAEDAKLYKTITGHFNVAPFNEDVTFTLAPGQGLVFGRKGNNTNGGGWNATNINIQFSAADPQILVYTGGDIKGDQVFAIYGWKTANGAAYTNINSCFYIAIDKPEKPKNGEVGYKVNLNEWIPFAYGFCGDTVDPKFNESDGKDYVRDFKFLFQAEDGKVTPTNFIIFDFHTNKVRFEKR